MIIVMALTPVLRRPLLREFRSHEPVPRKPGRALQAWVYRFRGLGVLGFKGVRGLGAVGV